MRIPRAVAVVVPAAALLLLAAPRATAATGIVSPGEGLVVAEHGVVPVRAAVDGPATRPTELSLLAPGADAAEVVAVSTSPDGGELAYDLDTTCARRLCSGRSVAPNGTWTVRLSGAAQDEKRFVVRIPPVAPTVLDAGAGERGAVVRWRRGDEPDLRHYAVEDADGRPVADEVPLESCDAEGTCRAEVPEQGGPWTVRAYRAACPDCDELLASTASDPVTLPAAGGPPGPATAGPGGVGTPGSPTPQPATRPGQADQRGAFTRVFGTGTTAVAPRLGTTQPAPAPLPDGSYDPSLDYAAPPQQAVPNGPRVRARQESAGPLLTADPRLLALGGLMVGGAVWLRRWARRTTAEDEL